MNKIRHGVIGLVLFTIFVGLFITVYNGIQVGYDVVPDVISYDGSNYDSIMDVFEDKILVLDGISSITNVFKSGSYTSLGAGWDTLVAGAYGILKSIVGVFTFAFEIAAIISAFYNIPIVLTEGVVIVMIVSAAFIIISSQTKGGDL